MKELEEKHKEREQQWQQTHCYVEAVKEAATPDIGMNCCFNESRVTYYLEQEPHPSSSKSLNHLFQSMFHYLQLVSLCENSVVTFLSIHGGCFQLVVVNIAIVI
ncbi:lipase, putative [Medicago truncatula]|uniref:Lipase, putative n=2 Tax=Medicago truncatula TaxID=3880 RepID=A0A072UDT6_MEDTR|nr:lipase, putative [Medicago truncatula]